MNAATTTAAAAVDAWHTLSAALPDTLHPALTPFKSVVWASVLAIVITGVVWSVLPSRAAWTRRIVELGMLVASTAGAVVVLGIGCGQHLPRPDGRRTGAFVPIETCEGVLRPWFDVMETTHVRAFAAYMGALAGVAGLGAALVAAGGAAGPSRGRTPRHAAVRRLTNPWMANKFDSVLFRSIGGGMAEVVCRKDQDVTRYVMHADDVANTTWNLF